MQLLAHTRHVEHLRERDVVLFVSDMGWREWRYDRDAACKLREEDDVDVDHEVVGISANDEASDVFEVWSKVV